MFGAHLHMYVVKALMVGNGGESFHTIGPNYDGNMTRHQSQINLVYHKTVFTLGIMS